MKNLYATNPNGRQAKQPSVTGNRLSVARIATPLIVGLATLAFTATPALAEAPEKPVTEAPNPLAATTATFNGELNPGLATENVQYYFAYKAGNGCRNGSTAPVESFPEAAGNHKKVTEAVTGLEGSTEYTVCLIAANPAEPAESTQGTSKTFTTHPEKPLVLNQSTSGVTAFEATLEAQVNPENQKNTECHFEYGSTTVTEHSEVCEQGNALEGGQQGVSYKATGLTSGKTYHYRVVVKNATGKAEGTGVATEEEFTTLPSPHGLTATFGSAGSGAGELEMAPLKHEPNPGGGFYIKGGSGLAVDDSTGDLYVADTNNNRVEYFSSTGAYIGQFNDGGALSDPHWIAVDNSTGDVYVTSQVQVTGETHYLIDKFSETGAYQGQLTGTCENENESAVEPGACPDSKLIPFLKLLGVAVDPAGKVWVYQEIPNGDGNIAELSDTGGFLKDFETGRGSGQGLAVDSNDNLYVNGNSEEVLEFSSTGVDLGAFAPGTVGALAVEPITNNLFVDYTTSVANYKTQPSLGFVEEFGKSALTDEGGSGVAVSATGTVYVADAALDRIDVFTESSGLKGPPLILSEGSSDVKASTATIETLVNPNNQAALCEVEYGTEPKLEHETKSATCLNASDRPVFFPPEFEAQSTSTTLPGKDLLLPLSAQTLPPLEADTTYYYRIVANAKQEGGTENAEGPIQEFQTVGTPEATTGAAENITRVTAALSGTLDPERAATTYHFVYISEDSLKAAIKKGAADPYSANYETELAGGAANPFGEGASTATHELPAGDAPVPTEPLLATGLLPAETYIYELVAGNEAGFTEAHIIPGEPNTFTTAPKTPPIVTTGEASAVTMSTATISGTVGTQGLDVKYAFETSTQPGNPTEPCNIGPASGAGSIGAGIPEESVSVALQGLQPGTTYYYCVLGTSTDGTGYGEIKSFTTPGFTNPLVQPGTLVLVGTPNIPFPSGSQENTGGSGETKTLTRSQKLAAALKACRKDHKKSRRKQCEKAAHKKFGPVKHNKRK
jgi:NHL repeat